MLPVGEACRDHMTVWYYQEVILKKVSVGSQDKVREENMRSIGIRNEASTKILARVRIKYVEYQLSLSGVHHNASRWLRG